MQVNYNFNKVNTPLVEVYCNGQWDTICESNFDQNSASTVCYQLGYTKAIEICLFCINRTGKPIWLDDAGCSIVYSCLHIC